MKLSYSLPFLLVFFLSILSSLSGRAVNAKTGLLTALQPDGTTILIRIEGNEFGHTVYSADGRLLTTDADGYYVAAEPSEEEQGAMADQARMRAARNLPGLMTTYFPLEGEPRALVVLVEFSDNEFTVKNPRDFYTRMLNEVDFADDGATGSARDYFVSNSSGKFRPQFDVYGPVKLSNDIKYYGANDRWGNDSRPQQMAIDACSALDEEVDFSLYDTNSDGIIDNVFFYYAGYGEADGGGANTIWPHSTKLSLTTNTRYVYDGVRLDRYACTNELMTMPEKGRVDGIGTFCHEFGHVLGLPDLYATTTINLSTPGIWDLMDNGSYNNSGMTPPSLSSYERCALGWLEPKQLMLNDYILATLEETNTAFIHKGDSDNEYFLFENRQQRGWDAYLPGHGMLIWHIDYKQAVWNSNTVNDNIWHQYVDLVEADGLSGIESRSGDAFPGSKNVTEFARWTTPAFVFWDNTIDIPFYIRKIRESKEGMISFSVVPKSFVPDDDEEDEEIYDDEEENGVGSVGVAKSFEVIDNMVCNYDGSLHVYTLGGWLAATLQGESNAILSPGFYIAVKDGRPVKILLR